MLNLLIKDLESFFQEASIKHPLLLAISGGGDSMALYHLLKKYNTRIPFIIAHIDHGWREESEKEAQKLKSYFEKEGIPFYLKTLLKTDLKGNLEDESRKRRYTFFKKLYQMHECQALLLAHHYNDQVETVLKRVLEGSSLERLYAMKNKSVFMGMNVWRPFLKYKKQDLLKYIDVPWFFEDPSNRDTRFLRARMREKLLPSLEENFGKKVDQSLNRLAKQSSELADFMEQYLLEKNFTTSHFSFGKAIVEELDVHPFVLSYLVKDFLRSENETLSSKCIALICNGILNKASNQWFDAKKGAVYQDRGRLFYFKSLPYWPLDCEIEPGMVKKIGAYEIVFEEQPSSIKSEGWMEMMLGQVSCDVPLKKLQLKRLYNFEDRETKKSLDRMWTSDKIPACLRSCFPIVIQESHSFEFLTKRKKLPSGPDGHGKLLIKCL